MSSGFKKTDKKGAPVPEINQPAAETAARQPGTEAPAETAEKKQSSRWKEILYPLLAALVIIGLWFGNIVIMSVNSKVFLQNTTMNGQDISGMTPAEAAGLIVDAYQNSSVSLMEDGKPVLTGDLKSYGFELDEEGLLKTMEQTLQEEKSSIGSIFNSITVGNEIGSDVLWNYDENTFKDKVRASSLTAARFPSENAYIDYSEKEGRCVIVDEVYGNEFEDADLQAWMKDSLDEIKDAPDHNFQQELPFPEQIYKKPAVTKDDADLIAETEAVNQYSGARVNYEFGEKTQVLGFDTIWSWFDLQGGEAHLNDDKVTEFVQGLEDRYNTRYRERTFINHYGNEVHFSPGDNEYGYTIIEQEEIDRLKETPGATPIIWDGTARMIWQAPMWKSICPPSICGSIRTVKYSWRHPSSAATLPRAAAPRQAYSRWPIRRALRSCVAATAPTGMRPRSSTGCPSMRDRACTTRTGGEPSADPSTEATDRTAASICRRGPRQRSTIIFPPVRPS